MTPGTSKPVAWIIGRAAELDRDGDAFWLLLTLAMRDDVPFPNPLRDEDKSAHLRIDAFLVFRVIEIGQQ